MVIGEKRRENKFLEKVRKNFEKFKDKIEKIGEKAIILGVVGGVTLGGCVNRKTSGQGRDHTFVNKIYRRLCAVEIEVAREKIYRGCKTQEDSIEATRRVWIEKTGSANPRDWEKAVEDASKKAYKRGDMEGLAKLGILMFATYPYSTMVGFYNPVYELLETYEKYKDVFFRPDEVFSDLNELYSLLYAAEVEVAREKIYRGCKTQEDSIEATRRVWIEKTGSANPRDWEKAVEDAYEREDMDALSKFGILMFATYPYSTMLGFHSLLYDLLELEK